MSDTSVIDPPTVTSIEPTLGVSASGLQADDTQTVSDIEAATAALLNPPSTEANDGAATPEAMSTPDTYVKASGMYHEKKSEEEIMLALREQWTKTLQQSPVSPEYVATHEGISFTPRTLAALQRRVEIEQDEFLPLEAELKTLPVNKVVHFIEATMDRETAYGPLGVPPTFEALLTELSGAQQIGEQLWDQFSNMMSDPNTTLEQVKELYLALYEEARLAPGKSWVLAVGAMLQDIISGRASQSAAR